MKPFVSELSNTDPVQCFEALAHLPYTLFLDSADTDHPNGRYAFICSHPVEMIESRGDQVTITSRDQQTTLRGADPFVVLQDRLKAWNISDETHADLPPFQGGAAGLFGYDLGRGLEKIPSIANENPAMPDMAVGIYDQIIAYDLRDQAAWVITHAKDKNEALKKQRHLQHFLKIVPEHCKSYEGTSMDWNPQFEPKDYKNRIKQALEYIKAGDIFQANLSQRFEADLPQGFSPCRHYLHLREVNAAPFAAFMNLGQIKISSASPERFVTVQGDRVETKPIKGTRPVCADPDEDVKMREQLLISEKDFAENTMIVDLLRNDLSKVCEADSVAVPSLCALESFASVHHLVSTITGTLQAGKTPLNLLRACFPGGSVTGAPKIRAMEIIEELEPERRGAYCGSIGYIGFNGTMDTNILIRTLVYQGDTVQLQVGGGITADSDVDSEYQETLDKAAAIFKSFETHKENKVKKKTG